MEVLSAVKSRSLRAYLTAKAKAGRFDKRMCAYYHVSPNVNLGCRRAICRAYAIGLVPTSTTDGHHARGSYHSRGRAVDLGLRRELIGTKKGAARLRIFQRKEYWRAGKRRIHPMELIGPDNGLIYLRGRKTHLREGQPLEQQHDNHVHEAY